MKLILDLDGTLLDYRTRAWNLFSKLSSAACSQEFYYSKKSRGISNYDILKDIKPSINWEEFQLQWFTQIESPEFLEYDEVFVGVKNWLSEVNSSGNRLFLCTARRNKENLFSQLHKFDLLNIFSDIFITYGESKYNHLSKLLNIENSMDWFISDSPGDIKTGKKLGIKTCSVGTGFRSNETLAKYFAELNIASILNFPTELLSAEI